MVCVLDFFGFFGTSQAFFGFCLDFVCFFGGLSGVFGVFELFLFIMLHASFVFKGHKGAQ